ncbi:MAG: GtrA family protein [Deltaproteobacteria bacterium]|nr:GtrA family protein [Deltaproteobacteria bacterium]
MSTTPRVLVPPTADPRPPTPDPRPPTADPQPPTPDRRPPTPARRRSLLVSVATTALDAGLFALATLFLAGPALAAARWTSGAIGAIANFALNRRWAFRTRDQAALPQLGRYAVAASAAVTLATLVWWSLHAATGWDPRLLQLASMAIVWLGFTWPVLRRWVFAPTSSSPPPAAARSSRACATARAHARACACPGTDTAPPRR